MRRRRQKNPLLGRIIGISILVHIIMLPILAHFGAFKKIQEHFVQAQMVVLPPPEVAREKPVVKPTKTAKAKVPTPLKGKTSPNHSQARASHSNLPQPHIAVAQGGKGGADGAGSAAEGSGKVGEVPIDPNAGKPTTAKVDNTNAVDPQPVKPVVPEVKQPDKQIVQTPVKQADPVKPPVPIVPKEAVFTAAQPLDDSQPKPTIPDALRSDALDKTFVAEFTVGEDGAPMAVKAVQSTGNDELDRRALDAAKKWRFKPATRDGQPVVGRVRLFIEFQVS
jgi:protein TonB